MGELQSPECAPEFFSLMKWFNWSKKKKQRSAEPSRTAAKVKNTAIKTCRKPPVQRTRRLRQIKMKKVLPQIKKKKKDGFIGRKNTSGILWILASKQKGFWMSQFETKKPSLRKNTNNLNLPMKTWHGRSSDQDDFLWKHTVNATLSEST